MMSDNPAIPAASLEMHHADELDALQPAPEYHSGEDYLAAERQLLVFRRIAAPLLAAITGWGHTGENGPLSTSQNAAQLSELIASTIQLNRFISQVFGLDAAGGNACWLSASGIAEIVAAHYRVSTQTLSDEEGYAIIGALRDAVEQGMTHLAPPSAEPEQHASVLGQSLKALAPAASAIARFSFGRAHIELLADVSKRLTTIAGEITNKLAHLEEIDGDPLNSPLYYAVLEVAGEFYKESHFHEMDRLLEMPPEERKEYVVAHGKRIPMEPVWERLGLRMGMLEALTGYLPQPGQMKSSAMGSGHDTRQSPLTTDGYE